MPYKRIKEIVIREIIRRIKEGHTISDIALSVEHDRKTVRQYIKVIREICKDLDNVTQEQIIEITSAFERRSIKQAAFEPYQKEIKDLLSDEYQPLKIKSVYEVIVQKYELEKTSLSSFKRYLNNRQIKRANKVTCRIERSPGEVQIDYAKMGKLYDPQTGKIRTLYAFIGTLSYSRHKYVEFVFSQNQRSFVESHIRMFRYFGAVPKIITTDNLKSAVIKPDIYNPLINRTYAEMAEYYKCFINPCRVGKPKDKPTVERDVQTVREEFRKEIIKNPSRKVHELNKYIKHWLLNTYGKRKHGTTNLPPFEVFTETEKPVLLPLSQEDYEITEWREVKVHPDSFIQVNKKSYSIPYQYVGKTLTVKLTSTLLEVYDKHELVKTHLVTPGRRQIDFNDFPENIQNATRTGMPAYLIDKAEKVSGKNLSELINKILIPNAYLNMRRAQGIISAAEKYPRQIVEQAAELALNEMVSCHPKEFKRIIINIINKETGLQQLKVSEHTELFLHPIDYFIQTKESII